MTHPQLVHAMTQPAFYPHRPATVQLVQTHISYIFIAGQEVFKVKKAVNFGFLDFTDLQKRKFYCHEELRLNRRLAPDTYLEVAEISEDERGNLVLGRGKRIVEYVLRMKRLPEERMLKTLMASGGADISVMEDIARKLAWFHGGAETGGGIDLIGGVDTIRHNHDENFAQTGKYVDVTLPAYQYAFIKAYVYGFLQQQERLLQKRVGDHKIRDCHGDLHLEHICVDKDIVIFDCIEFNERFRYGDVAAEVAFLAMDLDYNGYPDWSDAFVDAYVCHSGDTEVRRLLHFYKCYYAYVRGKVVSFRIDDPGIGQKDRQEAQHLAARYFDLAYTYAARPEKPVLILAAGLMGTGKSHLSRNIAPRIGADIIRTDVLRKELLDIEPSQHLYENFGQGIYGDDYSRRTYEKALDMAEEKLRGGRSVIIDASYKRRAERLKARDLAQRAGADFFVMECTCPDEDIRRRLEARTLKKKDVSDGRWEIFKAQREDFDVINEFPDNCHLVIDTAGSRESSMDSALRKLKSTLTGGAAPHP